MTGPATRRGDRVEKHLGAGRAALKHSSPAFVIGLPSRPEGGVHGWNRLRVDATGCRTCQFCVVGGREAFPPFQGVEWQLSSRE